MNQSDASGNTLLHFAAKLNGTRELDFEIERGSSVNARNNEGQTPLHIAYKYGKYENATHLILKGADQSIKCNLGKTPSDYDPNPI